MIKLIRMLMAAALMGTGFLDCRTDHWFIGGFQIALPMAFLIDYTRD